MGRSAIALLATMALAVPPLSGCGGGERESGSEAAAPRGPAAAEKQQATPAHPRPNPHPGSKAAAPGVPTSPEGDNSIQVYGVEGSDVERTKLAALVGSYLDARAAADWAKACAYLAPKPRAEQLRYAPGAGSCAEAMSSFAQGADPATLGMEAQIEVLSLRVKRSTAFLIYRRSDGVWATALRREGGHWKVVSVTPAPVG
jgi:hypothetical protein